MFSSEVSLLNNPLIQDLFFIVLDGNFAPRKSKRFPMKILVWFRVCHKCWKKSLLSLLRFTRFQVEGYSLLKNRFSSGSFTYHLRLKLKYPVLVFTEKCSLYSYKKMRKVLFEEIWLFHLSWVIASGMQFTRVVERQVAMGKCMHSPEQACGSPPKSPLCYWATAWGWGLLSLFILWVETTTVCCKPLPKMSRLRIEPHYFHQQSINLALTVNNKNASFVLSTEH